MASRIERLNQQRCEKLEYIRAQGIDPYPSQYHCSHTVQQAIAVLEQQESETEEDKIQNITIAGRITSHRSMGKSTFIDIRDGTDKIQLYANRKELGEERYKLLKKLDMGDIIGAIGGLFRTRTGEPTLRISDFTILCKSLQPLPEKWHGLVDVEKRYRQRYLDLISNKKSRETFIKRAKIITLMRQFLDERGFLEVETPILQPNIGGAMALPFVTHHHSLDSNLYLRIATELYLKRLVIGNFDKVYEIGRIFRNEGLSIKHNPEFTTLESYEAYADYQDVMNMVEEMIEYIAIELLGTTKVNFGDEILDFTPPWQRITLRDAIRKSSGIDFEDYPDTSSLREKMLSMNIKVDENKQRGKLIDALMSQFVEPHLKQPTFILDYPVALSPLAKRKPGDEQLVERFEAFAGGMEIANAFTELNDPVEQRDRFEQQRAEREMGDKEIQLPDEDFLLALEHGMPPTGGLGVGIDRMVMLFTNQQSIREVILFPQLKNKE
ncbi:MAG: lysine--tRNA ligase [Dehalococcoidia bacterium]|nr:lysine--tRNA ligase [Dehalococcoidia bacterium]